MSVCHAPIITQLKKPGSLPRTGVSANPGSESDDSRDVTNPGKVPGKVLNRAPSRSKYRAHDHRAHDHRAHDHRAHEYRAHDHRAHDHRAHDHRAPSRSTSYLNMLLMIHNGVKHTYVLHFTVLCTILSYWV